MSVMFLFIYISFILVHQVKLNENEKSSFYFISVKVGMKRKLQIILFFPMVTYD